MAPKNIDETIQKLLNGYAKWCETVLGKQSKSLQNKKFRTEKDKENAIEEYNRAKKAHEFLLLIAKDPKKYLYTGNDIIYTRLTNGKSIYEELMPILNQPYDRSANARLLVRLGEAIAHHVKYESNNNNNEGVWVYYGDSAIRDLDAEEIIKLNKSVALWNTNDFFAAFKDFLFPSAFAVDLYKKEER